MTRTNAPPSPTAPTAGLAGAAEAALARRSVMLGALISDLFLPLDAAVAPDTFWLSVIIRLGLITSTAILIWFWLKQPAARIKAWGPAAGQIGAAVVSIAGLLAVQMATGRPSTMVYQNSLALASIYLPLLFIASRRLAIAGSCMAALIYIGGSLLLQPLTAFPLLSLSTMHAIFVASSLAVVQLMHDMRQISVARQPAVTLPTLDTFNPGLGEEDALDSLTGAASREWFEAELADCWNGPASSRVALLLAEIDNLPEYNARYGRDAGDACLHVVAQAIQQQLRTDIDLLGRHAGGEFAILLPGADLADAALVGERVRHAVESLAMTHEATAHRPFVTLSIGVAAANRQHDTPATLKQAAAHALSVAKAAGRNRLEPPMVIAADSPAPDFALARRPRGSA